MNEPIAYAAVAADGSEIAIPPDANWKYMSVFLSTDRRRVGIMEQRNDTAVETQRQRRERGLE